MDENDPNEEKQWPNQMIWGNESFKIPHTDEDRG